MKRFTFIEATLNGVTINMNTCFISDIIEIDGKAQVFAAGEWWKTDLTHKQLLKLHYGTLQP